MYTVAAEFATNTPATAGNVNARRLHDTPVKLTDSRNGRSLWIAGLPVAPGRHLVGAIDGALDGDLGAGVHALTTLEGAFAAFMWDEASRRLVVVNDFAGLYPLYMRRTHGSLAVAPTIRELATGPVPDPAGWGAFVGFGHLVGERTSVDGITRVPPATVIEYEPSTDRLSTRQYWQWPAEASGLTLDAVDTGAIVDAIAASLDAYEPYGGTGTLLLSGGFESRLLAALHVRAGRRPTALTLRNPYEHMEIDGRFAARVARELGLPHLVRDPDPAFFSTEAFREYVRLHEVASTSVNLFIAQVLSELRAAGVQASWDGFPFGSVIKEKSADSFSIFLNKMRRGPDSSMWRAARQVFTRSFVDAMEQGLDAAVAREIEQCHPGRHGTQQFFHRTRIRHRIAPNTLKVYANHILPFLPGLTRDLYSRVVPIPAAVRAGEALYFRMFERHFPRLARLPWCSGGHLMAGTHTGPALRMLQARSAIVEHPRVGHLLKRFGLVPNRPPSQVVADAVRSAEPDDRFLSGDGVRVLQRTPPSGTNEDTSARELVFYWSMWREVMTPEPRPWCSACPQP